MSFSSPVSNTGTFFAHRSMAYAVGRDGTLTAGLPVSKLLSGSTACEISESSSGSSLIWE